MSFLKTSEIRDFVGYLVTAMLRTSHHLFGANVRCRQILFASLLLLCVPRSAFAGNPLLPGYFADPSVSEFDGRFYIYATTDGCGWGGAMGPFVCWESDDFVHWRHKGPIMPEQRGFMCPWAPGHAIKVGGRYILYPSLDRQIYAMAGVSPAGPFTNALGDRPFIPDGFTPKTQVIDGEPFEDDDGKLYFYWGNSQCYGVRMGPDGISTIGEPVKLTPTNFTEGTFVFKRKNKYYLTWSKDPCTTPAYQVHYAMGDAPLGPFRYDPARNPILQSDFSDPGGKYISGPGHHSVLNPKGTDDHYIVYHRHPYPWFVGLNRRVAAEKMEFEENGHIKPIQGSYSGVGALGRSSQREMNLALGKVATASSQLKHTIAVSPHLKKYKEFAETKELPEWHPATGAFDDNFDTRWSADRISVPQWLQVDLGGLCAIAGTEIYFEHPTIFYSYKLETSLDARSWTPYADHSLDDVMEAPKVDRKAVTARYVRLTILGTHSSEFDPQLARSNDPQLQKNYREKLARFQRGEVDIGPHSVPVSIWEFRVFGQPLGSL